MDIQQGKPLTLLPPAPGLCPQCAVKHEPEAPHDATSLYYGFWFLQTYGRSPTWSDAIAHCGEEARYCWTDYLTRLGIDLNSTNVRGDIHTKEDLDSRLDQTT